MTDKKTTEAEKNTAPLGQSATTASDPDSDHAAMETLKASKARVDAKKPTAQQSPKGDAKAKGAEASKPGAKSSSRPASQSASKPQASQKSGGRGLMWLFIFVLFIGAALTAGWPYVGPLVGDQVRTVMQDVRKSLGLTPRPTQARMPVSRSEDTQSPQTIVGEGTPVQDAPISGAVVQDTLAQNTAVQDTPVQDTPTQDTVPAPLPSVTDGQVSGAALDDVMSRLDVLETQINAVSGGDGQAALKATSQLAQTLSGLKSEIKTLKSRLAQMDTALQDALAKALKSRSNSGVSAQALVLAATQLRVRLMGDQSFGAELSVLEKIAGSDATVTAAVNKLRPHAEVGVPSEAALTARFTAVASDILRANTTSQGSGWLSTVKNSVAGLVTVRRTDPTKITNPVERAVAVTEAALQMGDLKAAVKALEPLSGPAGDAALAWLGDARARLDAESALESLYNEALAAMAQVNNQATGQ